MAKSSKPDTPNIIFCHVDQMRHDAISAFGNPHVSTPNLDALAQAGTSFLRAQASHPLSAPSRTSWYTGRMPSEHGCLSNNLKCLKNIPDLGQWMSARGYDCHHAGKWHLQGRRPENSFNLLYQQYNVGEHNDDACASAAARFLAVRTSDKPFFLNIGLLNPHDCCYMTGQWKMPCFKFGLEKTLDSEMPPVRPGYNPEKPIGREHPEQWNEQRVRLHNYVYYRQVEMVDECIGRIHRALLGSRFADNTVFIFSSDHGEMLGERNWFGKNVLWDGSLRAPLIIAAPGRVPENARNDTTLTMGIDVTATILDYADIKPMPGMTVARSLRPVLEGKTKTIHDYLPAETSVYGPHVSIRRGDYKSITAMATGEAQLYNTAADPLEKNDLAKAETGAAVLAEHRKMLADYQGKLAHCDLYQKFLRDPKLGSAGKNDDE